MPRKPKDELVTVNTTYVNDVIAKIPSDPTMRQTIQSLERISNVQCKVLERGSMARPDCSGEPMFYIKVVPTYHKHVSYRPPHDGVGKGIVIYFYSKADLEGAFNKVNP